MAYVRPPGRFKVLTQKIGWKSKYVDAGNRTDDLSWETEGFKIGLPECRCLGLVRL